MLSLEIGDDPPYACHSSYSENVRITPVNWMGVNISAFLAFVLVTTFTPGPANISSAAMGVLHGYKNTLKYLYGIATGGFIIMLSCGLISTTLLKFFPSIEATLRFIGADYILWLAFKTLRASYMFQDNDRPTVGFVAGLLLQAVNLKAIVLGLTLYSTFLAPIISKPAYLVLSASFIAAIVFCAASTWALFGWVIKTYLHRPRIERLVNLALSLLLVYTAIVVSGLVNGGDG